jgi:hypothetical protein
MMDHTEASRRLAAEQYLLGELNENEREAFEEHFFSCPDCADAVQTGSSLISHARVVLTAPNAFAGKAATPTKPRWKFLTEWSWAPAMALAGWVATFVLGGYQFLRVPKTLETGQLTLAPAVPIRAVRAGQMLTFSRQKGMIALTVAHEWEQNYSGYLAEIERSADHQVLLSGKISSVSEAMPLAVSIRPQGLETGSYFLALYGLNERDTEKALLERISFNLTE